MVHPQEKSQDADGSDENAGIEPVLRFSPSVLKAIKDVPIQIEFASCPPYSLNIGRSNKQTQHYK
jgi:hypothetical protein